MAESLAAYYRANGHSKDTPDTLVALAPVWRRQRIVWQVGTPERIEEIELGETWVTVEE